MLANVLQLAQRHRLSTRSLDIPPADRGVVRPDTVMSQVVVPGPVKQPVKTSLSFDLVPKQSSCLTSLSMWADRQPLARLVACRMALLTPLLTALPTRWPRTTRPRATVIRKTMATAVAIPRMTELPRRRARPPT